MQIFHKIEEQIIRSKRSFFLLRQLNSDKEFSFFSDAEIICNVINSKFHIHLGEDRDESSTMPTFYGYFDNEKLKAEDYKIISLDKLKTKLFSFVEYWNGKDQIFTESIEQNITEKLNVNSKFYHLDLDKFDNEKKADWHTYSTFIGFLSIDSERNILTVIEFGED